jgi:hypothetical protein
MDEGRHSGLMRHFLPIILLGLLFSGPAGASSFVAPKPVQISPSIIYFGEPEPSDDASAQAEPEQPARPSSVAALPAGRPVPGGSFIVLSPSVIALGEPLVETGQVASISREEKPRRNPHLPPMVIRGGIFGDPFARAGQGASTPAPQQATSTPPPGTQPQAPQPGPDLPEPEPALPPPAAPTGRPE